MQLGFFLAYLLMLLPGSWPCFHFGAVMIGLAIGGVILMVLNVAVGLLK